jgi:glycosyltransferase involved in cell wall biosynthesis
MNSDYDMAFPYFRQSAYEEIINNFKPDIVHITTPSLLGMKMLKIAKMHGFKVSTIYHTNFVSYLDYYLGKSNVLTNPVRQFLINNYTDFYNKVDRVLAPTLSMKNHLIDLGINPMLIKIMPRGINETIFSFENRVKTRFSRHFNNDFINVLFASRLVWEKNLRVIIELYNKVQDESININFIIVGSGVAHEEMREKMPKALFLGNLSQAELNDVYNEADIFLFPSVTETFGNVVLEAMACGLPVVGANGGSNPDIIRDGQDGFLVSELALDEYITAIDYIASNEGHYTRFVNAALTNPMLCSWQEIAETFVQELKQVAELEWVG